MTVDVHAGGRAAVGKPASPVRERAVRVLGAVVTVAALWSVLSVVLRGTWRSAGMDIFGAVNLPVGANFFSLALLVLLAGVVRRRLRIALWCLVLFQVLALADGAVAVGIGATTRTGSLLARFSPSDRLDLAISAVAALFLIPVLLSLRSAFPARLYPASWRPAALILAGGGALAAVVS
ncbi:MAG: lysyl-tRNA synthetase, class, partial [Blastococcus sp.]|nr:lysyl-tRNA synthetase, class [Blastococcus sp.]